MAAERAYLLVFVVTAGCCATAAGQRIVFVNSSGGGAGSGASWAEPIGDLQTALEQSVAGDQLWVAAGTYRPGSLRTESFHLKDGVQILGGFAGDESPAQFDLSSRDFILNETILEGAIATSGAHDNAFHVVRAEGVTSSAVLDGFTLARGNANGLAALQQDMGGGILILNASPTIRHCMLLDNQAGSRGGAVHISSGSPLFSHCRFVGNKTTVTQEVNNMGGGVYCTGTAATPAAPRFINCLFSGNRAGAGNGGSGGAVFADTDAAVTLVNCTLLHNYADTLTGGVMGTSSIANCVLYANEDRNGRELTAQLRGSPLVWRSVVQGGWPGGTNVDVDPLFRDALGPDGIAGTADDDARLEAGSPCIDAGDGLAWPVEAGVLDLQGLARFVNDPAVADNGVPVGAGMIDVGAFERHRVCTVAAECDDAIFCNGDESCTSGVCRPGVPPDCSDAVACTSDMCNEAAQSCTHEPVAALCGNGVFCDGDEICNPQQGCLPGPARNCDDAVACTGDICDEAADRCAHAGNDALCDDGLFCNGAETCESIGCAPGLPPCSPDEACDESMEQCAAVEIRCQTAADCEDQNDCTDHLCLQDLCQNSFNQNTCDDGDDCTEEDVCTNGLCAGQPVVDCEEIPEEPDPDEQDPDDDPPEEEDSDDDGVTDVDDDCPETPDGAAVDEQGCSDDEPEPGRGTWTLNDPRRCGACGAMGSLGTILMLCVPGTVLVAGRPRGSKRS